VAQCDSVTGVALPESVTCYKILRGVGKVVPVFFLTKHHAMKMYWGSGGINARILDLRTRRG